LLKSCKDLLASGMLRGANDCECPNFIYCWKPKRKTRNRMRTITKSLLGAGPCPQLWVSPL
jgi:hypothetical protein